jgi:hypothetical protein
MSKKVKVRFNLGRGKNYMKWKVEADGRSEYYNPEEYSLLLYGCQLKNSRKTAEKIHQGANKSVCAWILCDSIMLGQNVTLPEANTRLTYNPRVRPNWMAGDVLADNATFDSIWSDGRKLFTNK